MADSELKAMEAVFGALDGLEPAERDRVLRWAADKFDIRGLSAKGVAWRGSSGGGGDDAEVPEFTEVGDLVHAAQPTGGPQHALVVAYWMQEIEERDGWSGGDLNTMLKNLGHGLANVTKTLDSLKTRKPALVMQVGKSGRSRQARKTYKLTTAGVREVRSMLAKSDDGEET
jgi:hypothetical protein